MSSSYLINNSTSNKINNIINNIGKIILNIIHLRNHNNNNILAPQIIITLQIMYLPFHNKIVSSEDHQLHLLHLLKINSKDSLWSVTFPIMKCVLKLFQMMLNTKRNSVILINLQVNVNMETNVSSHMEIISSRRNNHNSNNINYHNQLRILSNS